MSNTGRFTWYELMSTDPKGGLDFYTTLVGWGQQAWPGEMKYDVFMLGEMPVAGCMQLPQEAQDAGAPTHWIGYIHTDDLAATVSQAGELGANLLTEMEIAEVGKIAVLHDPQGAVIAFFQPANEPGPEHDHVEGEISWHELATTDYEAAFEFYSKLFGWDVIDDMDMGEAGTYRMFGRNGKMLGGMWNKPAEMPVAGWLYYARVPSCDDAAAQIAELGGQVVNGPMEVPGGDKIVQAIDPQGGMFALHSVEAQAAEADG